MAVMNSIDLAFERLRGKQRKAFIPFLTAGDPDLAATASLIEQVAKCPADLIEIGFPYSDPIADGPVIQASYTRALAGGVRLDDVFACARHVADSPEVKEHGTPLVGMVSYALVLRRGPQAFVEQSRQSGLSGLIVPDLPLEESADLARLAADAGLCL